MELKFDRKNRRKYIKIEIKFKKPYTWRTISYIMAAAHANRVISGTDFITHRIQITEKTVKIRLTLLNFVLSLRKTITFQKCRNLILNRHL